VIELPQVAMPRRVAAAAKTLAAREVDADAARQAVQEASAAIELARVEDRALLADALDAGKGDPGSQRENEARARLADVERRAEGEELRRQRAQDELDRALNESIEGWEEKLTQAVEESEAHVMRLLDELEDAEAERGRRRLALAWAYRYVRGQKLPRLDHVPPTASTIRRHANDPAEYWVPELVDAIRGGVKRVTLAGEAARYAERKQREAEWEAARAKLAGMRDTIER
jgi:hypothetical protein